METEYKSQYSEMRKQPESIASEENWPRQYKQLTVSFTDEKLNETGYSTVTSTVTSTVSQYSN
jgi:hypothetical protein